MPRILIEVSEVWYHRLTTVIPDACDTLTGWEHRITLAASAGDEQAVKLLDQIRQEMIILRRNLESARFIF